MGPNERPRTGEYFFYIIFYFVPSAASKETKT
jgi:hypothetical protein